MSEERGGDLELAPQFPVLDSLRAVGALAVLTTHTAFQSGEYLGNGVWGTLLARLDVGVAIFFVLSGFLLARPRLARARLGLPGTSVLRYYEKRVLRIMPVYVVTVAVALTMVPGNEGVGIRQWASSLLLLDSYRLKTLPQGLTHMWSLSAEVAFYIILPFLLAAMVGRRIRRVWLIAVLLAMSAVSVAWHGWLSSMMEPHVAGATGLWLPAYLTWFAGGIALAWLHVELQAGWGNRAARAAADLLAMPGVCWTSVAGLLLLSATPLAGPTLLVAGSESESVTKHVIYAVVGLLIVGPGVFAPAGTAYARVMSYAPVRHLGRISYSIFCIHLALLSLAFAVLGLEPFTGHGLAVWAVTLVLTLVVSEILYRVVELPALRVRRRWRRTESTATNASAPQDPAATR